MQKMLVREQRGIARHAVCSIMPGEWQLYSQISGYPEGDMLQYLCSDCLRHLRGLGVNPKLIGYRCVVLAIMLYAANPNLMMKQINPDVARICGLADGACVERNIRSAIGSAWKKRTPDVWKRYFPAHEKCPTNKEFIAGIAGLL